MPGADDPGTLSPDDVMGPGFESILRLSFTDDGPRVVSCQCTGPRDGDPLCPCRMKRLGVVRRGNRWVIPEQDLGPVTSGEQS